MDIDKVAVGLIVGLTVAAIIGVVAWVRRRVRRVSMDVRVEFDETAVWDLALARQLSPEDLDVLAGLHTREQRPWLLAHGAVEHGTTEFRLTLDSRSDSQIVVRQISAQVLRRHPSLTATLVTSPPSGASSMTLLLFDLDQDIALAWEGSLDGALERIGSHPFFAGNVITVAAGESEHILIRAEVANSFVEWVLHVDLQQGRLKRRVTLYRTGLEPFRTTRTTPENYQDCWMTGVAQDPDGRLRPAQRGLDWE